MPTLRQLEYFLAVVDEGSFTRAADLLFVTQPGLSQQVAALERELGGAVFSRMPRAVSLTPTGRALLPHARTALAATERATAAARVVSGADGGELRIACVYSVSLGLLPAVLQRWRAEHPQVVVRLFEHRGTEALAAAMQAGQADVAIGPSPAHWKGRVRSVGTDEMVLVLPPAPAPPADPARSGSSSGPDDDPYAPVGGELALSRLAERSWVQYAPDHALSDVLAEACEREGFRPRVAVRTEQTAVAPLLAASGIGPALVPAAIVPVDFAGRIALPAPRVTREIVAYTGAEPDTLTARFVGLLARTAVLLPDHVATRVAGAQADHR